MASPSLLVLDSARNVALTAAELVANRIRARTRMRMLLPTGHTPRGLYAALRAHAADRLLPSEHVTVLGLDEYLGLGTDHPLSFHMDLDRGLAGVPIGRREALNGAAPDPGVEAARYEAVLDAAPIDLAVLGLGRDAHVAFNEPGSSPGAGVHRVALHPSTIAAAAADFGGAERVPREALTVGLKTLLAAREILLLVTGGEKAEALRAALEGPIDPAAPASLLRHHPCLSVLADRAAAARLRSTASRDSHRVAIVLGHREPGISAEHRISAHSRARLARAVRLCRSTPVRAVLLTGFTHTGGLSEAEQMQREWPLADVPVVLEVAGRNTAENASRSLPIVLALGVAARVTVVTSIWHLRAPYFFAPYRGFGLQLDMALARPLRGAPHLLAEELGGLAGMAGQRRAAMLDLSSPRRPAR